MTEKYWTVHKTINVKDFLLMVGERRENTIGNYSKFIKHNNEYRREISQ